MRASRGEQIGRGVMEKCGTEAIIIELYIRVYSTTFRLTFLILRQNNDSVVRLFRQNSMNKIPSEISQSLIFIEISHGRVSPPISGQKHKTSSSLDWPK